MTLVSLHLSSILLRSLHLSSILPNSSQLGWAHLKCNFFWNILVLFAGSLWLFQLVFVLFPGNCSQPFSYSIVFFLPRFNYLQLLSIFFNGFTFYTFGFRCSSNRISASKGKNWNRFQKILYKENHQSRSEENLAAKAPSDLNAATPIRFMTLNCKRQENYAHSRSSDRNLYRTILEHSVKIIWKKHKRLNGEELAAKAALQPWCGHSNTITNSQLQKFMLLCTQPQQRRTLTQSLHCDLLTLKCKTN